MRSVLKRKGAVAAGLVVFLLAGLVSLYNFWVLQDFTIIYTNDIHGRIGPSRRIKVQGSDSAEEIGGFASLATYMRREDVPRDSIVLDAGDFYQGTLEGEHGAGRAVVRLMNTMGYDAATIGNHDFHHGLSNFTSLADSADFPLLGANILSADTGKVVGGVRSHTVLERDGTKVGIVGIALPESGMEGVEFTPCVAAARDSVKELEEEGVRFIILLTHVGFNPNDPTFSRDYKLAKDVEGVDLIVGGHYHSIVDPPYREPDSGTLICEAGSHMTHVGRLDLTYNRLTGRIAGYSNTITPLWLSEYPEDGTIAGVVASGMEGAGAGEGEVLGYARDNLPNTWVASRMGALVTDLMREEVRADVAFINKSGVRDGIYRGEITYGDIYGALPFANKLVCFELGGDRLKEMLEADATSKGGWIHFSGLTAVYDMKRGEGSRVVEAKVGGLPIRDDETYRVCTIGFLMDFVPDYREVGPVDKIERSIRDLLVRHVKEKYYVNAPTDVHRVREIY